MSLVWIPGSYQLITCAQEQYVYWWSLPKGQLINRHESQRVVDMSINCQGTMLVTAYQDRNVTVEEVATGKKRSYNLVELINRGGKENREPRDFMITSVTLSRCSRYLLVHVNALVIYMFDLHRSTDQPCQQFYIPQEVYGRYIVRSCFGGVGDKFVLSGSEDRQVYIFMRETGNLLYTLQGHEKTVNCVHWNPANPHMFASCSDDHTVRIWGVDEHVAQELEAKLGQLKI